MPLFIAEIKFLRDRQVIRFLRKSDFIFHSKSSGLKANNCLSERRLELLPAKGVYTLILFLSKEINLKVGKLGNQRFPSGYYTYTGSALGVGSSSLRHRVLRHLKKKKRKFWHIDFLLDHKNVHLAGLIAARTDRKVECKINRYIKTKERAKIPVPHFGSSDCKENCGSHLLYFGEENIMKSIATLYNEKLGVKPVTVDFAEVA